jgi:hypothetical protein
MKHWPSYQEQERLKELQMEINQTKLAIMAQERFDKYRILIRTQNLANHLRAKWTVIKGGLDRPE